MRGIVKILFPQTFMRKPFLTLNTFFSRWFWKCCAGCAHRVRRVLQSVDALEPIGVSPCLQIRLAQFDSGSRLQTKSRYCSQ
jgi:hypothetical protein